MKVIFIASNHCCYRIPDKLYNELKDCECHYENNGDSKKFERAIEIMDIIEHNYKPILVIDHCITGDLGI